MTQLLPPKKEVALALLERSNVDVYLDPRAKGVVVPPQFRKEPRLILKIGLNMPVPIPDLRLDDDSMSCTLSFNRSPFYCIVPWSSVFAMVGEDGRGMVWPDDVPQELAVKVVEPGDGPRSVGEGQQGPRSVEPVSSPAASSASSPSPSRRNGRSSKLADDAPSKAGAGAGKRKKKKEEERPRPVLVAVPSDRAERDARPESRRAERDARPESRRAEHDSRRDSHTEAGGESPREIRQAPEQRRPQPAAQPREGVSVPDRASADRADRADRGSPRSPVSPRTPSSRRPPPSEGPARPKRELPPYLRVVK